MKTKRSRLSRLPVPSTFYSVFLSSLYFSYTPKNKPHRVYNGAFAMILQEKNADTSVMSSKELILAIENRSQLYRPDFMRLNYLIAEKSRYSNG